MQLDNNADDVMRLIGDTIRSVPPSSSRLWQSRIVLGCWAAKYLPLCFRYLPGFPVSHIGFSTLIASHFFTVPCISFNMQQAVLMAPWGRRFIAKAHRDNRPVYAWTVNDERAMQWGIRHGLDGVLTDDPKLFVEVRKGWHEGMRGGLGVRGLVEVARINFFALVYTAIFWVVIGFGEKGTLFSRKRAVKQ